MKVPLETLRNGRKDIRVKRCRSHPRGGYNGSNLNIKGKIRGTDKI